MTATESASSTLPATAEVVVIGGGVLGAAAAFHLAKLGARVTLLDRGAVGAETSSQGAGFLCAVRSTQATTVLAEYATSFYRRFAEETGAEAPLHFTGGLRLALSEAALGRLRVESELGARLGVNTRFMTAEEAAAHVPGLATAQAVGGMLVEDEGYVTSTREVALAFAHGARTHGSDIREHVEVTGITPGRDGTHSVVTDLGSIRTRSVVLAANAGIWLFARSLGIGIGAYPLVHQCAVYELASPPGIDMPTVRIPERDIYVRREGHGLLIGGVGRAPDGPPVGAAEDRFRLPAVRPDPDEFASAIERAVPFFPGLRERRLVRTQQGLAMVAPDLEPLAGEWLPGIHVMTADLRGIQLAPALGLLVAELIAGKASRFDAAPYRPDRLSGLVAQGPGATRAAARVGLQPGLAVAQS